MLSDVQMNTYYNHDKSVSMVMHSEQLFLILSATLAVVLNPGICKTRVNKIFIKLQLTMTFVTMPTNTELCISKLIIKRYSVTHTHIYIYDYL